jgi:RHS repeat-associated protein
MIDSLRRPAALVAGIGLAVVIAAALASLPARAEGALGVAVSTASAPRVQLPDGSWLEAGGAHGAAAAGAKLSKADGAQVQLAYGLVKPRVGHTLTALPDGAVLALGGLDPAGRLVAEAEVFDPVMRRFEPLPVKGLFARAYHAATVLDNGRVLITGGVDSRGAVVAQAEIWNPASGQVERLAAGLETPRSRHRSSILPSGEVVVVGGLAGSGAPVVDAEVFDPRTKRFGAIAGNQADALVAALDGKQSPAIAATIPAAEARGVAGDRPLVVRFAKHMAVASLNSSTVTLIGPHGPEPVTVVGIEQGLLLFVWPQKELLPGSRYTLFVNGASDADGRRLELSAFGFDTALKSAAPAAAAPAIPPIFAGRSSAGFGWLADVLSEAGRQRIEAQIRAMRPEERSAILQAEADALPEDWIPGAAHFQGLWHARRKRSPLQDLPALRAAAGVTALSGQVLGLHGRPLPEVTLRVGGVQTRTDVTGRFLLQGLNGGAVKLEIDGSTADKPAARYGYFAARVEVERGTTTVLPYTVWMPKLDSAGSVRIASPAAAEVIVRTPRIPGLELRIPAGTVIRDREGKVVTEVNITPIPVDRAPFPLPDLGVPVYFTVQPGGAILQSTNGRTLEGARLFYPNFRKEVPGAKAAFWNYDPVERGWYIYGLGTIGADARQAIPDPKVAIYEFTGAMINGGNAPPPPGPPCPACCGGGGGGPPGGGGGGGPGSWSPNPDSGGGQCGSGGDPVNLYTGQFEHTERDLYLPDVMPLDLLRTYRQRDRTLRAFGVGMTHGYDVFLYSQSLWQEVDVILPNGARAHFVRTTPGTGIDNAVFESTEPGHWYKAVISQHVGSWLLRFRDGSSWHFPMYQPINQIRDSNGNLTRIIRRDSNGNAGPVVRVVSPNGRTLDFGYNANGLVSTVTDNIGRQFVYTYDTSNRLTEVTDPRGKKRIYGWDANNRIRTIKDPNGNVVVTNTYETKSITSAACGTRTVDTDRVSQQVLSDTSQFNFRYGADPQFDAACGLVYPPLPWAEVTDRRSSVRRVEFNSLGQVIKNTFPLGKPEEQVTSYVMVNGLKISQTDALNRKTAFEYDALGNVKKVTRLFGTANAVSTELTWDPTLSRLTSVKDPNNHLYTMQYDAAGNLRKIINPKLDEYTITPDWQGRPLTLTNEFGKTTTLAYEGADLKSITDPLSRTVQYITDAVGRTMTTIQPLGQRTYQDWDRLNRLVKITDALGQTIVFTYDDNGNVLSQVDQRNKTITNTYTAAGRLWTRRDALLKTETNLYEPGGLLKQRTDRKGQFSGVTYDAMGRVKTIGFGATAAAPTAYTSTITLTWDKGNRLRQIADSVHGTTTRDYDDLDRLIKEVTPQGEVHYTYYPGGQPKTMIVRNGAPGAQTVQPTVTYTWDELDRIKTISQAAGAINGNTVQTVRFGYDKVGRRTSTTLANGSIVQYGYDDADQLKWIAYRKADFTLIGDLTYGYDANGRRISVGGSLAKLNLPGSDVTDAQYDDNNRLTRWAGKTFTYDDNGNLTGDGTNTYQWDARNQLKTISAGATQIASFQYDAFGRRSGKTIGASTTGFVYGGLDEANFVQELLGTSNTAGVKAMSLTAGIDETLLRTNANGSQRHSVLADGNNNTVRLLDQGQAKVVDFAYEPYGVTTADAATDFSQQYTGRENDNPGNANGLYYYRARYYMPGCGRFISEDPIGWASGQANNYAYVGGDPISYTDPSGLCGWTDAIVGFGDAFGAGLIRDALGIGNGDVDMNGGAYIGGMIGGTVWGMIPYGLSGLASAGGTRVGSQILNRGQNIRIGPGRMPKIPAEGPLPGLPGGPKVPRIAIGPDRPGIPPAERPHIDLRSRVPAPPPIGVVTTGIGDVAGPACP